ncbi:MAG: response regulator, partial [Myxococcota bacterium]
MARVLIIEDNATLREGVVQVLKRMKHETFDAHNGRVGLEAFAEHDPDLIVTDLKMDEVDGMTVLKQVHQ